MFRFVGAPSIIDRRYPISEAGFPSMLCRVFIFISEWIGSGVKQVPRDMSSLKTVLCGFFMVSDICYCVSVITAISFAKFVAAGILVKELQGRNQMQWIVKIVSLPARLYPYLRNYSSPVGLYPTCKAISYLQDYISPAGLYPTCKTM